MTKRRELACLAFLLFFGVVTARAASGNLGQTQADPWQPGPYPSTKLACASARSAMHARHRNLQVSFRFVNNLTWHGGEVMVNPVRVILIFVGFPKDSAVATTLTHFATNVGASDWWRTNTRYYGYPYGGPKPPSAKPRHASGEIRVVEPWYLETPGVKVTGNYTTDSIRMLRHAIKSRPKGWKVDVANDMYVLITSKKHYSMPCAGTCGIHSNTTYGTKFALVPEGCCVLECDDKQYNKNTSPYGTTLDRMVDILGHELTEMLTSPSDVGGGSGWWDDNDGLENADKCQNTYGKLSTMRDPATGRQVVYTHVIGGRPYMLPPMYDPTINPKTKEQWGCVAGVDSKGVTIPLRTK